MKTAEVDVGNTITTNYSISYSRFMRNSWTLQSPNWFSPGFSWTGRLSHFRSPSVFPSESSQKAIQPSPLFSVVNIIELFLLESLIQPFPFWRGVQLQLICAANAGFHSTTSQLVAYLTMCKLIHSRQWAAPFWNTGAHLSKSSSPVSCPETKELRRSTHEYWAHIGHAWEAVKPFKCHSVLTAAVQRVAKLTAFLCTAYIARTQMNCWTRDHSPWHQQRAIVIVEKVLNLQCSLKCDDNQLKCAKMNHPTFIHINLNIIFTVQCSLFMYICS